MKRLTEKKIFIEEFSEKAKSRLTDAYLNNVKLNNRLCEFEDLMEKYKIDNVEELDFLLKIQHKFRKINGELNVLQKKLKDRWKNLNDWLEDWLANNRKIEEEAKPDTDSSIIANIRIDTIKSVLYTMLKMEVQEREDVSDTNVGDKLPS